MLKDFTKLETFLVVVREKSFSKASAKLGISQPAVTQQIKYIEDYLDSKIIERRKNGIKLTKEGEDFYKIVIRLSKSIQQAEKDILKIINKEFTFKLGSTFTIGHYILPQNLDKLKSIIKNDVFITIDKPDRIKNLLIDRQIDLAITDIHIDEYGIISREWFDDELVIFSNQPIPPILSKDDLFRFNWICREEESPTRQLVSEAFDEMNIDCVSFNIKGIVDNSTLAKESILQQNKNQVIPTVSMISRTAIQKDIKQKRLFEARLQDKMISRKLYVSYHKNRIKEVFMNKIINFIFNIKIDK
jgi:DNA-binding transcriptional LysR family regulator